MRLVLFLAVALVVMLAISAYPDAREGRWRRILWSQPALLYLAATFHSYNVLHYVATLMLLFFIWRQDLTWHGAKAFEALTFGSGQAFGSRRAEFQFARSLAEERDFDGALAAIRDELEKEPKNYEGHILLATIYKELRQPEPAMAALDVIIQNPEAMPDQIAFARSAIPELRQLQEQQAKAKASRRG